MNVQFKIRYLATFVSLSAALFATAPAQAATITAWDFNNLPIAVNNSPAPSIGTGTASALGMTNGYTYSTSPVVVGSINTSDILLNAPASPSSTGGNDNVWRVRGQSPGNGWNLAAPQYTQGAEFDISTVGYSNIALNFDWYSTNQGVNKLQIQYNTNITNNAGWTNIGALQTATPGLFNPTISVNFGSIIGVNNDKNFGVRFVSAFDPTLGTYGSASGGVYNNNSGNWRFDNVVFSGTSATAVPEPLTIVGTLVGGAVACRMRKRLKVEYKDID